jgi:replicative superfamily II helicase
MVDFNKLRAAKAVAPAIKPTEIFRRLPKPAEINDLYTSQAEVLDKWFERRTERDLVLKLHTGGGKTLVGLLIGQSVLNETQEPVIYLCPTNQLVEQTLRKAAEYGIAAVRYEQERWGYFSEDFLSGKSLMICNYDMLFNGKSRFGVRGIKNVTSVAAVIADDAHVAFSSVRDAFTLRVDKLKTEETYRTLTNMFRGDFDTVGRVGTFDDIVSGKETAVIEVPHWCWQPRINAVRELLRPTAEKDYMFVWPFLRDNLELCHVLIGRKAFVLTPILPLIDLIPTFADCPRRIYMSATIGDDSAIVRTFDADVKYVANPIRSESLAGVSERMILLPDTMGFEKDIPTLVRSLIARIQSKFNSGVVILVPSEHAASSWKDVAEYADTTEKVADCVKLLQSGQSRGPFVFANRYDGIDLPGEACRFLVMSNLPTGYGEYDQFMSYVSMGGVVRNNALAQRIEQGIGRGARGSGDYCVVILAGPDLNAWLGLSSHRPLLTSSTQAQLEMGLEISKGISNADELFDTIRKCLERSEGWPEYHAGRLAELSETPPVDHEKLEQAAVERKAFRLCRDGYHEKAIGTIKTFVEGSKLDHVTKGWMLQTAARAANLWGRSDLLQELQRAAYAQNSNVSRPKVAPPYVHLLPPGKQAEEIVEMLAKYRPTRAFLSHFEEIVAHLVPEASSNQFEEALASFGEMLGFRTERPEKIYGKGPDVLWRMNNRVSLVIEAKSRKHGSNPLTKDQQGQLLVAGEWFKKEYPTEDFIRVSLHPNVDSTDQTIPADCRVLTLEKLNSMIADARGLFRDLCESLAATTGLQVRCESSLKSVNLRPEALVKEYLSPFRPASPHSGQDD